MQTIWIPEKSFSLNSREQQLHVDQVERLLIVTGAGSCSSCSSHSAYVLHSGAIISKPAVDGLDYRPKHIISDSNVNSISLIVTLESIGKNNLVSIQYILVAWG